MKYYTFKRESDDFSDILNDLSVKKEIDLKIRWKNHLLIGFQYGVSDRVLGYIVLKYGEDITSLTNKNYIPIPNVDYTPKRTN